MRSVLALVQAAAGDVPSALRTADLISFLPERIRAYGKTANILSAKADFAHAKRVIQAMEDDWFAGETEAVVRTFTQAQATGADETETLVWARQQKNVYARAQALVGVALGIMQRHSPYIDQTAPEIPMRDRCS